MKILIATPLYPPEIGGPATYAETLAKELPRCGDEVTVVSYGMVRHLPKLVSYPLYTLKVIWGARRTDLVLALDPMHTGLSGWLASVVWRKKFVVRIVGDYAWEQGSQRFGVRDTLDEFVKKPTSAFPMPVRLFRHVQVFVASRAEMIIVPSKYLEHIVEVWGVASKKVAVVYNAFSEVGGVPNKKECRRELGLSGRVILSAGRLVPWKGFEVLLHVMNGVLKKVPDAKLYIAGSGTLRFSLANQITTLRLEDHALMLGNVDREKLMRYIRAADCFVLNTGYEGLSHQLLEVLAVGTPIVTTRVGGNPELIEHGVSGTLVSYNDRVALEEAIEGALRDRDRVEGMTEKGRKFVASFTVERMVRETKAVLQQAIK